ncbi:NAD(P)-dependent oxidoreductase [Trinickia fusca]|uniref:NAD-dependent epimerase/dehydratase family protein n=1 Tax=Trinickia fusca TaxID=2419777 RepID=A0A494XTC6_9BURK|nr:NAD(P)H-binding protein [Trinickia fusca]RKP52166.1 NAD-dependent epimerase/dehydratase family protein [Trinickia fusca]
MQKTLKIALFGSTGMIGSRIAAEAARRGHQVTAFARRPERLAELGANVSVRQGDLFDTGATAATLAGYDVIASAYAPPQDDLAKIVDASRALVELARASGVKRVVAVGGAGSLEVAPGKQLVDTDSFPAAYKAIALAHRDALGFYRSVSDVDWTFFAPAALIAPGTRTGTFRTGTDALIVDAEGKSAISAEDYAVAFVDELEAARFTRKLATVGY